MKCVSCGYQNKDRAQFTYFPKQPEYPLCHDCTEKKFGGLKNLTNKIVSSGDKQNE